MPLSNWSVHLTYKGLSSQFGLISFMQGLPNPNKHSGQRHMQKWGNSEWVINGYIIVSVMKFARKLPEKLRMAEKVAVQPQSRYGETSS